jgi:pre-mRNA-processing factor 40
MKRQFSGTNGARPNDPRLGNHQEGIGNGWGPPPPGNVVSPRPYQPSQGGGGLHRNLPPNSNINNNNNYHRMGHPFPGRGGPNLPDIRAPPNLANGGGGGPPQSYHPLPPMMGRGGVPGGPPVRGGIPPPPLLHGRGGGPGVNQGAGNLMGHGPFNAGRGINNGNGMVGGPPLVGGRGGRGSYGGGRGGERRPSMPPPPPPPIGRAGIEFHPPHGPPPPPPRPFHGPGRGPPSLNVLVRGVPPPPHGGPPPALHHQIQPQQSYGAIPNPQQLHQHHIQYQSQHLMQPQNSRPQSEPQPPHQHQQQQQPHFPQQQYQQVPPLPVSTPFQGSQGQGQLQLVPPAVAPIANRYSFVSQSQSQGTIAPAAQTNYPQQTVATQAHISNPGILNQVQPASSVATAESAGSSVKYTIQQIDDAWQEYTDPSGLKYYHNSLLKESSTYIKPDAMKKKEAVTSTPSAASASVTPTTTKHFWRSYEDSKTGRKYYSDGITTTWDKPDGFVAEAEQTKSSKSLKEHKLEEITEPPKKKKRGGVSASDLVASFANKGEAIAAFKGALLAKGIGPALKWNEVVKLCETDSRWEACKEVLSVGERRQALAEYQTKRANEIRNEQRQERIRAKEAFGQLLADLLPGISLFSAHMTRFSDVRSTLSKDDRFYAVEDEATRESLFLDFCDEFKKREERKKRSKKREAQDFFVSFLQEMEENGTLTFASTWESFFSSLSEKEKADSRFATSTRLSDSDRQLYFADFVIDLQQAEDDKRRRIRDARRRAEKAQRDKYREYLRRLAEDGKIFPYSRWRGVEEIVSENDAFALVQVQDRDSPRELFEEFIDEWDEIYRRERSFLGRLINSPGKSEFKVTSSTSYEAFKGTITTEASYSPEVQAETWRIIDREDPVSSARLFYNELIARAADVSQLESVRKGSLKEESSEDEGEIIEPGEVSEDDAVEVAHQVTIRALDQPTSAASEFKESLADPPDSEQNSKDSEIHEPNEDTV